MTKASPLRDAARREYCRASRSAIASSGVRGDKHKTRGSLWFLLFLLLKGKLGAEVEGMSFVSTAQAWCPSATEAPTSPSTSAPKSELTTTAIAAAIVARRKRGRQKEGEGGRQGEKVCAHTSAREGRREWEEGREGAPQAVVRADPAQFYCGRRLPLRLPLCSSAACLRHRRLQPAQSQ